MFKPKDFHLIENQSMQESKPMQQQSFKILNPLENLLFTIDCQKSFNDQNFNKDHCNFHKQYTFKIQNAQTRLYIYYQQWSIQSIKKQDAGNKRIKINITQVSSQKEKLGIITIILTCQKYTVYLTKRTLRKSCKYLRTALTYTKLVNKGVCRNYFRKCCWLKHISMDKNFKKNMKITTNLQFQNFVSFLLSRTRLQY
eukprot:TRINITY_DN7639_c0_g1_i3.p2 TRINITY_DN7639_c0_g1~~TRINITY_DN7639_c0_g1_i3.p2  ORF type:complete len:198 (-),score=-13.60 TRINITY_DN7639_c0_g1_i3:1920-2513(-)